MSNRNQPTYYVVLADMAFRTADVIGVHASRRTAEQQAAGEPDVPYFRPTVWTATELAAKRRSWDIAA